MFLPQEDLATKFKNNKFKINQNTFLELHVPLKNNSILKLNQLNLKKTCRETFKNLRYNLIFFFNQN